MLFGSDPGEIDGFMVIGHTPDDGLLIGGSLSCQHCRAGYLIEAALRVLADAPHEEEHPPT